MFRNLFDVRKYLSNKDIKRVRCSRLSGKYFVSLADEEVDIHINSSGLCEVVIVNKGLSEQRLYVEKAGERMLKSFLDVKLVELMT